MAERHQMDIFGRQLVVPQETANTTLRQDVMCTMCEQRIAYCVEWIEGSNDVSDYVQILSFSGFLLQSERL